MIKNIIISIIIIVAAALTVYTSLQPEGPDPHSYLAFANIAIGFLGVLFILGGFELGKIFVFFWIVLQFALIKPVSPVLVDLESTGLGEVALEEISFAQYPSYFPEGAEVTFNGNTVKLNVVPFIFLLVFLIPMQFASSAPSTSASAPASASQRVRQQVIQAGEFFDLKLFRWNQLMEHIVPQRVQVLQKVDFNDSKNWFLVKLSKPVKFKGGVVRSALIKPKEGKAFVNGQPGQLGYFRLLKSEKELDLRKTRFVDWVLVR